MALPPTFPELVSLDLYASVVEYGSVSRAARAHGTSQPSASVRIRRLERQLGLVLLERSPSGSRPTAAGALVADWARSVLAAADGLALGVAALVGARGAQLRLAASYTIAEHLLPGWLAANRAADREVVVDLDVVNSAEVLARVRGASADVGFVESPGRTTDLASSAVGRDRLVVVVWPTHPWAERGSPLRAAELAGTPLVLREEGSGTRDALATALADAGTEPPERAVELRSNAAVRAAVLAEAGPAVLSQLAVEADVTSGRLRTVAVEGIELDRELRAVWRRDVPLTAPAATLLGLARRANLCASNRQIR